MQVRVRWSMAEADPTRTPLHIEQLLLMLPRRRVLYDMGDPRGGSEAPATRPPIRMLPDLEPKPPGSESYVPAHKPLIGILANLEPRARREADFLAKLEPRAPPGRRMPWSSHVFSAASQQNHAQMQSYRAGGHSQGNTAKRPHARYGRIWGPRCARAAAPSTTEFEQKLSKSGAPTAQWDARRHAAARSRSTSYLANVLGGGHIPR